VTLTITRDNLPSGMDLMSDVVLHPTFKEEELDRQREQLLSALQVQSADPNYLASAVFDRVVYPGSPYGLPSDGTVETAGKFNRESIVKFHASSYAPNEALMAFAGDITPEAAFELATRYFGGWEKKEVEQTARHAPAAASGVRIWVVDKPDIVQTQIRIGRLGIRRADPDYIPLLVANRILGGGYNSRLNTEVRINKGLTYGANSSFHSMKYTGSFDAGTYTRTAATVEATKLMVDLMTKMAAEGGTPAEMDFARDYLAGVYPIQSRSGRGHVRFAGGLRGHVSRENSRGEHRKSEGSVRGILRRQGFGYRVGGKCEAVPRRNEIGFPRGQVGGNFLRPPGFAAARFAEAEGSRRARARGHTGIDETRR
jgi:zinc protease